MNDNDFPALGSKRAPVKKQQVQQVQQQPAQQQQQQQVQYQAQPIQPIVQQQVQQKPHIIDIGANLADKQFDRDLNEILARSSSRGVNTIVITGTSIRSSQKAIELMQAKKDVLAKTGITLYSTAGVHPHEAERAHPKSIDDIRDMVKRYPNMVKCVGECGLDFNRNFSSRQSQIDMFTKQIEVAIELGLPLFIHERDSHTTFVEIVGKYVNAGKMPKSVVHCFTGTEQEADVYLKMGFYFGFTGVITQDKRGETLRKILKSKVIPLNRIMIETDCPYMTPHNLSQIDKPKKPADQKGHIRNEPCFLTYVLTTIAQCYGITEQEAAHHTYSTTKEFFNLP